MRFGIVLDRGDLGGNAVLVALEIDDAVLAARAAALVADGDLALHVAAGVLLEDLRASDLSGVVLVISSKVDTVMKRWPAM